MVVNRQDLLVGVPEAQDVVAVIVLRIYILRGIERRTDVRVGVDLSHDSSVSFIGNWHCRHASAAGTSPSS